MQVEFEPKEKNKFKPFILKIHVDDEFEARELSSLFSHIRIRENLSFVDGEKISNAILNAVNVQMTGADWRGDVFLKFCDGLRESFQ